METWTMNMTIHENKIHVMINKNSNLHIVPQLPKSLLMSHTTPTLDEKENVNTHLDTNVTVMKHI